MTMPTLKRQHGRRAYEQVAEALQEMIRSGQLELGDQLLSERGLVEKFGVSRATVRQALHTLASRGVITIAPRGGAYVSASTMADVVAPVASIMLRTPEDVLHLLEVRRSVQVEAARLAATRATEGDIYRIREAARAFAAEVEAGRDASAADAGFHLALCEAAHNPFFVETMRMFLRLMEEGYGPFRSRIIAESDYDWGAAHFALLAAIEDRDGGRVVSLMTAYLDAAARTVRELFMA